MSAFDRFVAAADVAGDLPIVDVLDSVIDTLATGRRLVLQAPPGAGKTTIVPLVLAAQSWCEGQVIVLEPRRLAVRAAATRMAELVGERPGRSIGWRMRQDTKESPDARVVVVTEGVLTRMLQQDPELTGISAVVFDEFHERSLDADVGLTLTLDAAGGLRDDLRIVVMSATLDADPVADLLAAPVITSSGRLHPVERVHVDVDRRRPVWETAPSVILRALAEGAGDVLVFLPGAREIDRTARALAEHPALPAADIGIRPLYGALDHDVQDAALRPAPPGERKVVLSTSIAETSLTIEGIGAVVDAGWRRTPRLDPRRGMSQLVTLPVTRAEADQRAGRAGRLGPGLAYRMWSRGEHASLRAHPEPEIEVADLAPLALQLAAWGATEDQLAWVTAPPAGHLAAARSLLELLGALDGSQLTGHGRAMADLALHPRLAHLLLTGAATGHGSLAAEIVAALGESGLRSRSVDLADRIRSLRHPNRDRRFAAERARRDAARWRREVGAGTASAREPAADPAAGALVAHAFPDRIARVRLGRPGSYVLVGGGGASLPSATPLAGADYLCVTDLDGDAAGARIREAVPLDEGDVRQVAGDRIEQVEAVWWDAQRGDVTAVVEERFGSVVLRSAPIRDPDSDAVVSALLDGIRTEGLGMLHWDDDARHLQDRIGFLHRLDPDRWPPVDDEALLDDADIRIGPHLSGCRRRSDLRRVDPREVLLHGMSWADRQDLDRLAPERLPVPSGSRHRVDYGTFPPVLAVKLQEMFGATDTPTVGGGAVPVVLHLLSPAGRPLQVTQDLPSFWAGAYADVRADMRGRYPKHPWPEDPTDAEPTSRTTRRR